MLQTIPHIVRLIPSASRHRLCLITPGQNTLHVGAAPTSDTDFIEMHLGETDQRYSSPYCVTVPRLKHNLADRHDRSRFVPSPSCCWMSWSCFIRSPTRFLDSMFNHSPLRFTFVTSRGVQGVIGFLSNCNDMLSSCNVFSLFWCLSDVEVIPKTDSGFNAFSFATCVFDFLNSE